ncbi:hypothetical protein BU17DRAFT_53869 [Hysterangium stoloniferum]|nr:hypothetical protein BU17DRAFT_53869 [Hysterangium stoloniferum]
MILNASGQQPLEELLEQLRAIVQSIPFLESQGYKPPIIDGDGYNLNGDPIIGLRIFRDAVGREVEILEQFLARPDHGPELSTNASYFIAVWNEILAAPPPIVAIGKIYDPPRANQTNKKGPSSRSRPGGIKVDVVADEGRKWIRVNTMKNSRIMAEFREFDSYLTYSDEEDGSDASGGSFDPPTDQDNSLLRMGRALVAASATPVAGTSETPTVTLRLTRLQPDSPGEETDPRIGETIDALREMGLDVQLGERPFRSLTANGAGPSTPPRFYTTNRINLDLSMLIALVSDLSHAKLPHNEAEAWARFKMPSSARTWKLGRGTIGDHDGIMDGKEGSNDYSKHSRALSLQCLQEMEHGLVEEVVERLTSTLPADEAPEFWTTEEARDRCLQIVNKIGGEHERRRAHALFPSEPTADIARCREDFWQGSRYPASYFSSFLPIHIYSEEIRQTPRNMSSLFWGHLIQTCQHILAHDAVPHPRLFRKYGEMERAKVSTANTKLTVHTMESMLVGAWEGMTTLTANKSSVKAILREMKGVKQGSAEMPVESSDSVDECGDGAVAAIWIVEPRSLAEGMRVDLLPTSEST